MASVLFIIRIPYEENFNSSIIKREIEPNSSYRREDKEISQSEDDNKDHPHKNIAGVKCASGESKTDEAMLPNEKSDDTDVTPLTDQTPTDVEIINPPLNLSEVLQNELNSLHVQGDLWTITKDNLFYQVEFLEKQGERVENILEKLTLVGIGKRPKSSVSIIPTSVHIEPQENENVAARRISECENTFSSEESQPLLVEKESAMDQFKKSIKSRLTVEQVVESVRASAFVTFDFVMFAILASTIAATGLVEDNAVVVVASMLVSPLMGPVLGATFGTVIKNKNLRNKALKTELCGLILSLLIGFLFGLICGPFGLNGASWDGTKGIWPTKEMTSRGMTRSLWVGVLIALPSGAGVALSVLGGNTGSLVGVAISASLLVPPVNSGILWAYSIMSAIKPPELLDNVELFNASKSKCPPFKDNSYMPTEAAIMAIISLVLTIVNIICIFITATIVLKIKEVTPKASSSNPTQTFWTKDIKIAREAYKTFKGKYATNFLKEWKKVYRERYGTQDSLLENKELLDIIQEVENDDDYQGVVRRAPRTTQNLHRFSSGLERHLCKGDENTTEKEAEQLQHTLRNLQTQYTRPSREQQRPPHVGTIFSEPSKPQSSKPEPTKPETTKSEPNKPEPTKPGPTKPESNKRRNIVREFNVVDTENPHHTVVVRVHSPNDDSKGISITTESEV